MNPIIELVIINFNTLRLMHGAMRVMVMFCGGKQDGMVFSEKQIG